MGALEKVNSILNGKKKSVALEKINEIISGKKYNPFLDKNGEIKNKFIDYQKVLDNPKVNERAKTFITQATGLVPNGSANTEASAKPSNADSVNKQSQSFSIDKNNISSNNSLVNAAKNYIGTPYVWGGESMKEGGMDCSGFVYNALKDAGYDVGRTTAQGYRSYGTKISKNNMQPGDLVFFGSGNASHIGIYIGNGQMIHSSGDSNNTASNPGKGVSVTNVDYRKDFLEARRY